MNTQFNPIQEKFSNFIVIDTLSTGFEADDEIISCTIVDQDGTKLLDRIILPFNKWHWDCEVLRHNLCVDDVECRGIHHSDFIKELRATIQAHTNVVIYNSKWDTSLLPNDLFIEKNVVCAMETSMPFLHYHPSYEAPHRFIKLPVLAALLEVDHWDLKYGTSYFDAELCRRVWIKMISETNKLDITAVEFKEISHI